VPKGGAPSDRDAASVEGENRDVESVGEAKEGAGERGAVVFG